MIRCQVQGAQFAAQVVRVELPCLPSSTVVPALLETPIGGASYTCWRVLSTSVHYSTYGHIRQLALTCKSVLDTIDGVEASLYQVCVSTYMARVAESCTAIFHMNSNGCTYRQSSHLLRTWGVLNQLATERNHTPHTLRMSVLCR